MVERKFSNIANRCTKVLSTSNVPPFDSFQDHDSKTALSEEWQNFTSSYYFECLTQIRLLPIKLPDINSPQKCCSVPKTDSDHSCFSNVDMPIKNCWTFCYFYLFNCPKSNLWTEVFQASCIQLLPWHNYLEYLLVLCLG
jgi:hypothetical protein